MICETIQLQFPKQNNSRSHFEQFSKQRTNMRLESAPGVNVAVALGATSRGLFRVSIFGRVVIFVLIVASSIAAVEIGQHLVGRQVHVVDAVTVDFDRGVQRAARLGEIDALFGRAGLVGVGRFVVVLFRFIVAVVVFNVFFLIFVSEKHVNVLNEAQIPRIARIDFVFRVHANGFLVEFRQVRSGCCCCFTTATTAAGSGVLGATVRRLQRIAAIVTTAVQVQKARRGATAVPWRRVQRGSRRCHAWTGRALTAFCLSTILTTTRDDAAGGAFVIAAAFAVTAVGENHWLFARTVVTVIVQDGGKRVLAVGSITQGRLGSVGTRRTQAHGVDDGFGFCVQDSPFALFLCCCACACFFVFWGSFPIADG